MSVLISPRDPVTPKGRFSYSILSAVTGRDLQASAQREDGWCESLQRGRSVAREPVEMKQGSIPVSFRRLSPLSLVECVSSLAEQTKSGGTASFRPDTKGLFLFFARIICRMLRCCATWLPGDEVVDLLEVIVIGFYIYDYIPDNTIAF